MIFLVGNEIKNSYRYGAGSFLLNTAYYLMIKGANALNNKGDIMFLIMFLIKYITEQVYLSSGTLLLSIIGIILSCIGLKKKQLGLVVQISRILLCLVLPIENFLMYLGNFDGNAADGFEFIPFSDGEKLRVACQVFFIFLPEMIYGISKRINVRTIKWLPWIYPIGIIVFHLLLPL